MLGSSFNPCAHSLIYYLSFSENTSMAKVASLKKKKEKKNAAVTKNYFRGLISK